jgi:predicted ATP-binding protein involved in virulence
MRINRIELTNFKKYEAQGFDLHPNFTLFIGDNGSGKTTILDALAVAMGVWLAKPPTKGLVNSGRRIVESEVRLTGEVVGDRIQFSEHRPVAVKAIGSLGGREGLEWTRKVAGSDPSTNNSGAKEALGIIQKLYAVNGGAARPTLPVLGYYGAGRAWMSSRQRSEKATLAKRQPSRFDAYYDCLNERIRLPDLNEWFLLEMAEAGNRGGKPRPGLEVVRHAIRQCLPGCDLVDFSSDRREITVRLGGVLLPFSNLSAGQRTMVALIADLAIRAVTLNAQLLPAESLGPEDEPLPRVLRETPGVVLIDELDVHLHPKWQRHVVDDLRRLFPEVQFIATTHSPFIVQSMRSEELRPLDAQPVPETGNLGVEEISRLMGVRKPEVSVRYGEMKSAAKHYLQTLDEAAKAPAEKLAEFEAKLAEQIGPYADNPAFQAFLEMKHEAKLGGARRENLPAQDHDE